MKSKRPQFVSVRMTEEMAKEVETLRLKAEEKYHLPVTRSSILERLVRIGLNNFYFE